MIVRGAVGTALVAVGGLVTQVLPWSSPIATAPLLSALRATPAGRVAGFVVLAAGLALLGSAWLRLLAAVDPERGGDPADRLWTARLAAFVWSVPLLLAPPLFSRDAWSYAAQGELTHIGLSPYIWTPSIFDGQIREAVDPIWMNTATPYGPIPLAWGSLVAGFTDNPWVMVIGYRLLALLGLALLAWAVPRLARGTGADAARATALTLACPLTIVHGVGGVHNDLVMAGLMAAALAAAFERWWLLGAALAGAAAAVKLPGGAVGIGVALVSLPLLAPPLLRLRRLTTVALVATGVLVASGVATGVGVGWVHALGTPGLVRTPLSVTTWLGVETGRVGRLLGIGPVERHAVTVVRTLGLGAALGGAGWVALRTRTGDRAAVARAIALMVTAIVVLSPAVHAWYLLWSLPFLAVGRWGRVGDALVRDAALVLGIGAPLDSSLRGEPTEILVVVILVSVTAVRLRLSQAGRAQEPEGASVAA